MYFSDNGPMFWAEKYLNGWCVIKEDLNPRMDGTTVLYRISIHSTQADADKAAKTAAIADSSN